jgi:hypothetical protein
MAVPISPSGKADLMRTLLAAFVLLAATFTASAAFAGPSAGLLFGNGFKDGYNLGIGARVGITLPVAPVYLGGTFIYHIGKTDPTAFGDVTRRLFYFGAEGGYDSGLGPLVIRPYLGLGYASPNESHPGGSSSNSKFAIWPGVTALVALAGFFVGADARYVIITDSDSFNAFSLFATAGLMF